MFKLLARHRDLLIVSALLVWPLISYLSRGHRGREPNLIDRSVLWLSTPVQSGLTSAVTGVAGAWHGYFALRGAHEEATVCREQLSLSQAELNSLREMEAENQRLKAMLAYTQSTEDPTLVARVIGWNPSAQFMSIRIDRGEDDGVRVGMPVVTPDGAVGQVVRAVSNSADVMLLTDPASHVAGVTQRARVRTTVSGTGGGRRLQGNLVRRDEDVKDGDLIVTSGTDGIFPRGVKLGNLREPERPPVGMFLRATVDPAVDFARVEEVFVIPVTTGLPAAALKGGVR